MPTIPTKTNNQSPYSATNTELYNLAVAAGCTPEWSEGLFGYQWRCTCQDNNHGIDQQCSDLSCSS